MSNQTEMTEAPSCSLTGRSEAMAFIQEVERDVPADVYQQFLAILTSCAQDPGRIEDVYSQVESLFATNHDLFTKFQGFLPKGGKKEEKLEIVDKFQ